MNYYPMMVTNIIWIGTFFLLGLAMGRASVTHQSYEYLGVGIWFSQVLYWGWVRRKENQELHRRIDAAGLLRDHRKQRGHGW